MKQDLAIDAARFAKLHARLLAIALARHHAKGEFDEFDYRRIFSNLVLAPVDTCKSQHRVDRPRSTSLDSPS